MSVSGWLDSTLEERAKKKQNVKVLQLDSIQIPRHRTEMFPKQAGEV